MNSQIGKVLTDDQLRILYTKFSNCLPLIRMKKLGVNDIRKLLKSVDCVLMTQTIAYMISQEGYVFDGLIGSTGLSNSLLYRVFKCNHPAQVFCAKVYLEENKARYEAFVSSMIHDPTPKAGIVKYICIQVKHIHIVQESMALLMPLYRASLEDVLEAFQNNPVPFDYFIKLAKVILAAVSHFHVNDLCHCDIKPANIMVSAIVLQYLLTILCKLDDDLSPVLIDFGAVIKFGETVREYTHFYRLDAELNSVGPEFDLNCVAVTLARCFFPSFELKHRSKAQMIDLLNNIQDDNLNSYVNVCVSILDSTLAIDAISRIQLME